MGNVESRPGIIERGANFSKKVDVVTVVGGAAIGNAPLVIFGVLSYFTGDYIEDEMKGRRTH